jgi:glutamyl-tRNA synthetase
MTVRTRFAPSPTGFLHLGGARTALFAWAFARHHDGTFILRLEDTDRERSTPEAVQAILDAMAWLELDYDEGPFYQMQRMDRYRAVIDDMLERGLAYRDYMTPAELDALRAEQMARGEKPRYDGRWRPENAQGKAPPPGAKPVVRFRNPDSGTVAWDDGVKGRIEFANAELDDLVIARADGTPTYNFCVVVDDADMRITHVIRGDDHVNNTPRQINIFRALGITPPAYAHVPTVLGEDGAKLSKRHGAVGVMEYEAAGYLPEAMVNFLARIGWAHGDDELFSRAQLVEWFSLEGISPAPSRFNLSKLNWVNQEHMKRMPEPELGERLAPYLARAGLDVANGPEPAKVAALLRDRAETLVAMADQAAYFYAAPHVEPARVAEQVTPPVRAALVELHGEFASLDWTREALGAAMKAAAGGHGLKPPQVMMAMRLVVCGTTTTPAIDAVLMLLGRETVRARMSTALGGWGDFG